MKKKEIRRFFSSNLLYIVCFYIISHLTNLLILPIFNDESIYLDWGWRSIHFDNNVFMPLQDAKTPLLMWVYGMVQSLPVDPLFIGRSISIACGLGSVIGLYILAKKFFDEKMAVVSAVLYSVIPLFFLYDRQALMESAIAALGMWGLYILLALIQTDSKKYAMFLGILFAVGYYIKSSMAVFIIAATLILLMQFFANKNKKIHLINGVIFICTLFLLLVPLFIQPLFWATLSSNDRYIFTISELIHFAWIKNIMAVLSISFWWLTPPVFVSFLTGIYYLFKRSRRFELYIFLYFLIPIVLFILITRNPSPRYLEPFLPLSVLLCSLTYLVINRNYQRLLVLIALILLPVMLSYIQITNPVYFFSLLSKVTQYSGQEEYVTNWTSGYGVKDAIDYVAATNRTSYIGVRLDSGNPENAVFVYTRKTSNVTTLYLDPRIYGIDIKSTDCIKTFLPLYFIARDAQLNGMNKYFQEIKRFYKPNSREYVGLFTLKDQCTGRTFQL